MHLASLGDIISIMSLRPVTIYYITLSPDGGGGLQMTVDYEGRGIELLIA